MSHVYVSHDGPKGTVASMGRGKLANRSQLPRRRRAFAAKLAAPSGTSLKIIIVICSFMGTSLDGE